MNKVNDNNKENIPQSSEANQNVTIHAEMAILEERGYKILTKINEGAFAKVYTAEFATGPNTKIPLAVKVLQGRRRSKDILAKFIPRELSILSQISHPYIIHVHSILQIGSKFFVFMRFAERGDLLDFIHKHGPIKENQARVWGSQIALAIEYLHVLNIAHRDIKCDNILVTWNCNLKLSDFGFARYTVDSSDKPLISETYCGTMLYAAPEIIHGNPYNAKLADLWSIGVVIFVILNQIFPFEANNARVLYDNQIQRNYSFREKIAPTLSMEVKELIGNLLEPEPLKRWRIEAVINSDWIAMDKQLLTRTAAEKTALSNAYDRRAEEKSIISIEIRGPQKYAKPKADKTIDISEIKPLDINDALVSEKDSPTEFRNKSDKSKDQHKIKFI